MIIIFLCLLLQKYSLLIIGILKIIYHNVTRSPYTETMSLIFDNVDSGCKKEIFILTLIKKIQA